MPGMTFKQLEQEVTALRDELAKMRRLYEDLFYNLDEDNFSSRLLREKENMKTEITATAEGIKTKVSVDDLENELSNYSTAAQTAESIHMAVVKGVKLSDAIQTDTMPDGSAVFDRARYYLYHNTPYYYNTISGQWEMVTGDNIYTMFEQTAEGFLLKGNTVIDGSTTITKNLTLSGNVTWSMENSPVKAQYSADCVNWHEPQTDGDFYMRLSFDGGRKWSTPTKVAGTDGKDGMDGKNGTDANVTPQNVFDALTDNGEQQGLFSAFIRNENKLYINAEYLQGNIVNGLTVIKRSSGAGTDATMIMQGNYFEVYEGGNTSIEPKLKIGYFLANQPSGSGQATIPQIVLGTGDTGGNDRLFIQKFENCAYITYLDNSGSYHRVRFDRNGVDFSEAGAVTGVSGGNVAVFG